LAKSTDRKLAGGRVKQSHEVADFIKRNRSSREGKRFYQGVIALLLTSVPENGGAMANEEQTCWQL
jgi:hypothetical protein